MNWTFDEEIDRTVVPALKVHPMVLGDGGEDLFPAGVADMDFQVAPAIQDAIVARSKHGVLGYETVPSALIPNLAAWLDRRHRWQINQSHILRAPNVLNSLAIAASLFSDNGDGVIVQPPVFFDFFDVIKENHRTVVENPLKLTNGRYEMDFEGLEKLAAEPKNKMLFLCNPHNPIGRVWRRDELIRLGEICKRNGVLVVADELHGDIAFEGHPYTPFASLGHDYADNSITLLSPAKTFNIAGCCWSFTVVPNETRRSAFQTENSRLTVNKNNAFSSVAMQAAYGNGDAWLDAAIQYLTGNLNLVRKRLDESDRVTLVEPEGTFLVWLDFRRLNKSPEELNKFLRQQAGWAVTRGISFGEAGAGFARLNIACPRARLDAAMDQLIGALAEV